MLGKTNEYSVLFSLSKMCKISFFHFPGVEGAQVEEIWSLDEELLSSLG